MWRWLWLFLLTPCVYAEDACASIMGDASRMRCNKRQAASQKKAPAQKPSVSKAQASANALTAPVASSNHLAASLPATQSKMPSKKTSATVSKTGNPYQGTRTDRPLSDAQSTRPIDNQSSGSVGHFESATSSVGSSPSTAPEGAGFYAYENDRVGEDSKVVANHSKALKQDIASSSQHQASHMGSAHAQSFLESASHTKRQQLVEIADVHVFDQAIEQGGAVDALPSIQGTWGE